MKAAKSFFADSGVTAEAFKADRRKNGLSECGSMIRMNHVGRAAKALTEFG
jgi:hypothetical protein